MSRIGMVAERKWTSMAMSVLWVGMLLISLVCGLFTGRAEAVAAAAVTGAADGVELCLSMAGMLCLWMGVMEVMDRSGLSQGLARLLRPVLCRLFPDCARDRETMGMVSANISANLLGLGNAATPLGLAAMKAMAERNHSDTPTKGMILFVVINTASIQLLPVNMAAMRSSCGSAEPFGILPEIWMTSLASLTLCVAFCKLMEQRERLGGRR